MGRKKNSKPVVWPGQKINIREDAYVNQSRRQILKLLAAGFFPSG